MGKKRERLNKWIMQVVNGIEEPFTHQDILTNWDDLANPRYRPTTNELVSTLRGLKAKGLLLEHPEKVRVVYSGSSSGNWDLIGYVKAE